MHAQLLYYKKHQKKVIAVRVKIVIILGVEKVMVSGGHCKESSWGSSTVLHFNLGDGCLSFLFMINHCFLSCLFFCIVFHYYFKNQKENPIKCHQVNEGVLLSAWHLMALKCSFYIALPSTNLSLSKY